MYDSRISSYLNKTIMNHSNNSGFLLYKRLLKRTKIYKTVFILAVIGAYILGNAQVLSQWLGWLLCTLSCLIWIIMGIKDKDIPRTLMEIMYFIIGIRAVINWLNFD